MEGDVGRHGDVAPDTHEVDVDQFAARGVTLNLAGQRERGALTEVQRDQCVGTTRAVENALQFARADEDRLRIVLEAVHGGGNLALAAVTACGAGTEFGPRLDIEGDVRHGA